MTWLQQRAPKKGKKKRIFPLHEFSLRTLRLTNAWSLWYVPGTPRPTIKKWMEMVKQPTISYVKIGNHPIETTIYKWLFGVPGGRKMLAIHFLYLHLPLGIQSLGSCQPASSIRDRTWSSKWRSRLNTLKKSRIKHPKRSLGRTWKALVHRWIMKAI